MLKDMNMNGAVSIAIRYRVDGSELVNVTVRHRLVVEGE